MVQKYTKLRKLKEMTKAIYLVVFLLSSIENHLSVQGSRAIKLFSIAWSDLIEAEMDNNT